jgi:polysaccharide pyruvyl transferase WcaK-like protein
MTRMLSRLVRRPEVVVQTTTASGTLPSTGGGQWFSTLRRDQKPISPVKIGIFGLFGNGNAGNDGSLEAMVAFLRRARPDAELTCICACIPGAPEQVSANLGLRAIPLALPKPMSGLLRMLDTLSFRVPRQLASLVRAISCARSLDALIAPGTGVLDDFTDRPSGMPLALFGWCLAAKLCGTSIALVSVGAGPIQHPISRWLIKSAAGMARYRSYRDAKSKAFMESIGFDTRNDAVYPDIAFELPVPPLPGRQLADGERFTVGVGVMAYLGWRDADPRGAAIYAAYLEKMTKFVLWLTDRGHCVRILTGQVADRRLVDDLVRRVAVARPGLPHNRLLADQSHSLHDLMRQIAETDVVVATRFHNVVCALKMEKPTISIGYGQKHDALMAEMGLGRFCQHIERLDFDLLIEQFTQLISNRQRCEQSIRATKVAYGERLERQRSLLASQFL